MPDQIDMETTPRGPNEPDRRAAEPGPSQVAAVLDQARASLSDFVRMPRLNRAGLGALIVVVFAVWLASGIYKVQPDETGVVLRFGRLVGTSSPGLNFHLPYPIETVLLPRVTQVNQLKIGNGAVVQMLTGDENIVEANAAVFWRIKDVRQYLFNVYDPEGTVRVAAESAVRTVIGTSPIQAALSDKRQQIADESQELLQRLLDSYQAGILVTQVQLGRVDPPLAVIDAFNDVQRARADQERLRNEAEAYRNDIIPRARGEADRISQDAGAFREQVVNLAQGEAERFDSLYATFRNNEDVTSRRLYIETMEEVLRNANKVVVDSSGGRAGVADIVPYLPLPDLRRPPPPVAASSAGAVR